MKVTKFFMNRTVLFWSLMIGILIAGVLAFVQMPKLEDPEVTIKQAMVVVPYPGATTHEAELKVAIPMEDALRTLPKVTKIKSECQNDMVMITVEFDMAVPLDEIEQYFDLLRRKVNDVKTILPQECYDPVVLDDMMDVYGIFYALTGEGYDYTELEQYAKYIRRELLTVKGVKRVTIAGTRSEVIDIIIPKDKIASNGIIPTQIMMCLNSAGKVVNAGNLQIGDTRLKLIVSDAVKNEEDIRNLKINTTDGSVIRLGDIAKVKRTYSEPQRNGFFVHGKPALAVCVSLNNDVVVPDVGKDVDKKLNEIMKNVPVGMQTEKIFFQPDKVSSAVNSFMINLLESVLIVILILIFTMGIRSGVIIGFGLLLTIALSFPILLNLGTTLQRISLGAFIVAMGMLVDNAIVIMDGILVDKNKGFAPKKYLYRIGKQTAMPLLGATVIAASTFIAIYMSPGTVGEYAGDLFLVLCVSLLASWVLALVQVPVCAKSWLPPRADKRIKSTDNQMNSKLHRFFRRIIAWMIDNKTIAVTCAVIVLAVCGAGFTKVKNLFFPDFDYKQFIVEYSLPSGTSPDKVKQDLITISQQLEKNKDIERIAASQGSAPARYCLVRPMTNGGDSYGEFIIDCKDYKTVCKVIPQVRQMLRENYPDAYIRIRKYNFSVSTSHPVEAEFSGADPAVLKDLCEKAQQIMKQSPYIDKYSVQSNWKPMDKTLVAQYIQQDALRSGIQRNDVGNALLAATDGTTVGVLNDNDKQVLINLKLETANYNANDIKNIPVWSTLNVNINKEDISKVMTGAKSASQIQQEMFSSSPLSNVIQDLHLSWNEPVVYRVNGVRSIEAECDFNADNSDATAAKALASVQKQIEDIPLPEGYKLRWVGEIELQSDAIMGLMKYVPLMLFLILGVLLLLFNSWKQVFLIFICFPFVICGIVPSLLLTGQAFTFMAIIGVMGLMGMMVKNSIVLIDEVNRLIKEEKLDSYSAIVNATVSRVRPVIMASATTIVGMLPLLTDPMYCSMAIVIMGGLAVGTFITLILLPTFYSLFYRVSKKDLV
ncbi:MAG: efflux RND transporter permease subunit [Bacteroidales bacterium]|nr:efflux RND transporter permease subunit [Bacteroidales bacterium]